MAQRLFYSELKKQLLDIDKIEDKKEKNKRMSILKFEIYSAVNRGRELKVENNNYFLDFYNNIKQVIIALIDRIKNYIGL